jgi:signal transduction histidine kinase
MKTIVSIAAVTLLLMLLSGLSLLGMDPEASRYDRLIAVLSQFAITESTLRQDILNSRAGLLRNYDPLDQEMNTLHDQLRQLRQQGADNATLRPMEDLIAAQDILTEQFKTNNALLQNSLAYFGLMSGRFGVAVHDEQLASALTALSTAVLHLTLDTSANSAAEVEEKLDRFAVQAPSGGDAELAEGILMHGRVLHRILPATDHLLEALYDLPRSQRLEALRADILVHQKASRDTARIYRGLLFATSMLLLALLVYSATQLRLYVRALRRQAEFERAIAAISMQFMNARPDEIGTRVESALAMLAERFGADRAYFVSAADPPQIQCWSRDGTAWPSSWPVQATALNARVADSDGTAFVPDIAGMPEGPDRNMLTRFGLLGWTSVSAYGRNARRGVLGFDAIRSGMPSPCSDRSLLRMAADTIANAVGHAALERDRARLEASLEQVRRMETIGAVASGVAHNFNNIIGVILGYTEMEEAHARPDSRLARNLDGIRHAAERARDLIDKVLTFGRRKEPPCRTADLQSLMAETQSLLSAALPQRARVVVAPVPEHAVVAGDPAQLQQVIMNLCNNAVQAMDGAGMVSLETDIATIDTPRQLTHGVVPKGRYVRIAVRDTGRGIDAAALSRLFEPFFTTRSNGNGLGLPTVREIVRSYGGALDVWSQPGTGSLFTVWLPQADATTDHSEAPSSIHGKGETVLVIDEDRTGLLHHEEIVAALGYEPVGFAEPEQVLRALRTTGRRFDALLIGNLMPTTRALALATALHAMAPDLPILLTASADDLDADALTSAGVSEVVAKPLHSAELAAALSRRLPA